jgi:amino acid permease
MDPVKEIVDPKYGTSSPSPDIETGDVGIKYQANPLARELQGRHMQMIAIGTVYFFHHHISSTYHITV